MQILLDANVLLRLVQTSSVQHAFAVASLGNLQNLKHETVIVPQSLYEFWVVATRPVSNNGLGLSVAECDQFIEKFLAAFPLLEDTTGMFANWRALALANACMGKVAHDARYVSAMALHGINPILTFNTADFKRFASIVVIDPVDAAKSTFTI